ncbi:MAG: outer membrane protein assembly factor BamA [Candidatus Thiodiazotropha sp. (ex Ctena orbiculata)]|uniref:Outer membrane protein assembly factor BamA n=1 Tax=Candidatus Thiodiazotropha taylori TaxID=2792791 RepID=A0A944M853_9GAMM|nr:outer membrane protein assembly factor BamA [Candidatus Thiodiazotropha taylori]PUB82722.1 MAG: outer membrane protein assembly factor BamA [gamma proteobacterium symbiont of Ctena orbiculata]MBT2988552.1 outer membrane protein assembly factor BamA [Candidatus Thiodiazotropha taylori]MBT2997485.1 outer membrane protein assembly factor BamA [Candidatus Thiodiazotropha taylori]MBT3001159.1 outer membrane protein assembly factor BamA [Candidatus Thiodiazotropha taylori]
MGGFLITQQSAAFVVEDIRVEGLQRISAGTVFNYLPIKTGDEVDAGNTAQIIRTLYKTGFFKDIRLERDENILIVFVRERPAIAEINISGNKELDTEPLMAGLKDIGLAEGRVFKRALLEKVEQELNRQYFARGKYGIKIKSTVTPLERNRVGLGIEISEGLTARIKHINIIGNQAFEDDELLDEFELGVPSWYAIFSSRDKYSKQALSGDLETLRSFYLDRGFIDFKIESTQVSITPDKQDIYITVVVDEGDVFTLSDIKLAGELELEPEELFPLIHLRRGSVFSRKKLTASADRLNRHYSDVGYAFANVNTIPDIDREKREVAITFFVDPGKRVYVRYINISGNTNTRDEVLRRELRQMESAWFSGEKTRLSRERLQRLGYFSEVNMETPAVPGSTDQVDVNIAVTEAASGQFSAGVGFTQTQGVIFNASISENNFLGTGNRFSAGFDTSEATKKLSLSYTNPYYTIDGVSQGYELSYRETDFSELNISRYSTDVGRLGVHFGIPLTEYDRLRFSLAYERTTFFLGSSPSDEIMEFIETNGDEFDDFELVGSWIHDTRDRAIFPNRGGRQVFSIETNVPGSDLQYYRVRYNNAHYFQLTNALTLKLNGELGYGEGYGEDEELPFFRNFFAGGIGSVRGFEENTLGPQDSQDDALGANARIVGQMELLFPAFGDEFKDTVRAGFFVDVGNVFDLEGGEEIEWDLFRASTGLMLSWFSPVGALSFSWGYPIKEEEGDDIKNLQFRIGGGF